MNSYNGWANYETWRINLEALDGMTLEDFGYDLHEMDADDTKPAELLGDRLESYVTERVEFESKGFALNLALSFLSRVDWVEIAEHIIADAKECA